MCPTNYWQRRKSSRYYRVVVELAKKYVPKGDTVLDVGGLDCEYLLWMTWFKERTSIDLRSFPSVPGLTRLTGDFIKEEFPHPFDLVTCLQVIEHVKDPPLFCQKLFRTGKVIIISVPYKWKRGLEPSHLHDPIDERKVRVWTGKDPNETVGVESRLILVYLN